MENATFTPLVFSTTGGMGRAATTFYRRLASLLSDYNKGEDPLGFSNDTCNDPKAALPPHREYFQALTTVNTFSFTLEFKIFSVV